MKLDHGLPAPVRPGGVPVGTGGEVGVESGPGVGVALAGGGAGVTAATVATAEAVAAGSGVSFGGGDGTGVGVDTTPPLPADVGVVRKTIVATAVAVMRGVAVGVAAVSPPPITLPDASRTMPIVATTAATPAAIHNPAK